MCHGYQLPRSGGVASTSADDGGHRGLGPPNAERARRLLGQRGVQVVDTDGGPLPFADGTFELVTARHPVRLDWAEIRRVLQPGGRYVAQHVGPASAFELIEHFLGPLIEERRGHDPEREVAAAEQHGLAVERMECARCRMGFHDVGAIVWILRKCVWWVPDFSVARFEDRLRELDAQLRGGHPFVALRPGPHRGPSPPLMRGIPRRGLAA